MRALLDAYTLGVGEEAARREKSSGSGDIVSHAAARLPQSRFVGFFSFFLLSPGFGRCYLYTGLSGARNIDGAVLSEGVMKARRFGYRGVVCFA